MRRHEKEGAGMCPAPLDAKGKREEAGQSGDGIAEAERLGRGEWDNERESRQAAGDRVGCELLFLAGTAAADHPVLSLVPLPSHTASPPRARCPVPPLACIPHTAEKMIGNAQHVAPPARVQWGAGSRGREH